MNEILKVNGVSKTYANHQALDNVSLSVPRNSIYGLLGPNGAGKTSLIRIITQIIGKDSGEILFDGKPLNADDVGRIGYLPEERGLYKKMKVGEQLVYLAQLKGLSKKDAMTRLKAWFEKFEMKSWWSKNIEDLSKGMQQNVQFVATVLHEPELIILDEPFSGFDPVNANLIKAEIMELREKGSTIIFSTHRMESVEEICDDVALINKSKKILEGTKKDIKNHYKSNTFQVEHIGMLENTLPSDFRILSQKMIEGNFYSTSIQIEGNNSPNDLLMALTKVVEVHNFIEKIPSMNDIFISLVTDKKMEEILA